MDLQIDSATDNIETSGETEIGSPGRITPARQTVLQILKATHLALTHHEIEQQAKAKGVQFDRVTLYRALEWLVTKELAHRQKRPTFYFQASRVAETAIYKKVNKVS